MTGSPVSVLHAVLVWVIGEEIMNWTSRTPIEGVKCIVETEGGCVFPAHCINGTWWNTEKGFPLDRVKRWIVYPEGEQPNDLIAPEALLKYLMKAYRESQSKLEATRELNKSLVSAYNKVNVDNTKLKEENKAFKDENRRLKSEMKRPREQAQKLKGIFDKIGNLIGKASLLEVPEENQTAGEFVA